MKKIHLISLLSIGILFFSSCSISPSNQKSGDLFISQKPYTTTYNVGNSFDSDGLTVIELVNGTTVTDYSLSISEGYEFKESDAGEMTIEVSHSKFNSAYFSLTITNYPKLEITSYPRQEFEVGDRFSTDGLVVTANGEEVNGWSTNIIDGVVLEEAGSFVIQVSCYGYGSTSYMIEVTPQKRLSIKNEPNTTTYFRGDRFSSSGLVVVDEKDNVVTDYTIAMKENDVLKYEGTIEINVSKENYRDASFEIVVNDREGSISKEKSITTYYINDTHGSFIRQRSAKYYEAGMSCIGRYITDQVNLAPSNSLVLSGGDMFQGGYESNLTKGKIMIEAMNIIGFDAMVLGNHEFDWTEDTISDFNFGLDCPLISCNTFYTDGKRPEWVSPYAIIDKGDVRIGIIGAARENLGSSITGSISNNFSFPEPNSLIKSYSDELRLVKNCDLVFAAFHDEGFEGYNDSSKPTKYSDLTLVSEASGVQYVDAMFFSHDHLMKKGTYETIPYIESGCNSRYVGELTINLESDGYSYRRISSSTYNLNAYNNCIDTLKAIDDLSLKNEYKDIIAHADDLLYVFKNSYTQETFTQVVTMAMYWYVNNHKEEFDNLTFYAASHNAGGVRSNVNSGNFTNRQLIEVFPFDNLLSLQNSSRTQFENLKNDSYYVTYQEGEPVFTDGLTNVISINFCTESRYAYKYQSYHKNFEKTAREALLAYLSSGVNPDL